MRQRLLACLLTVTAGAVAQPVPTAKSAIVVDVDTDTVLFEKNHEDIRPIASITKLMNAIVVIESGQSLEEEITITQEDVTATIIHKRQTGGNLPIGTTLTRAEMLHLALMNSQNRAAYALARSYEGGVTAFVERMNQKAIDIGMLHTTFTDPTGLYNTNVSTAQDLTKLVATASDYQLIRDFSTSKSFETTVYIKSKSKKLAYGSTNRLTHTPDWNLIVQKTGYITDAGRCMVVMTMMGTRRVVMVLLNTPTPTARLRDAIKLRYWIENNSLMPEPVIKRTYKRKQRK